MTRPGSGNAATGRCGGWWFGAALFAGGLIVSPGAASADAVSTWNEELLSVIQQTSALLINGPPEVAREMSILDSAMFDAANAASGSPYAPIAYTGAGVTGAAVEAAALAAGYTAMQGIFNNAIWSGNQTSGDGLPIGYGGWSSALRTTVQSEITSTYTTALAALGTGSGITTGTTLGAAAGNANLSANGYTVGNNGALATDGSATAILNGLQNNAPAGSGTVDGVYVPPSAMPGGRPEMMPLWGSVTPTGLSAATIASVVQKTIPGPPAINSPAYASALLETTCAGSSLPLASLPGNVQSACAAAGFSQETAAQAKAALFWNDPGTTYQPPGHWLQIADTVAQSGGLNTLQHARLGALVSQAEEDAGIAAWEVKYRDNLWRPVTAITSADCGSWNVAFTACDAGWSSLIATPPHPDYVAGHPAFSGAAATVLDNFFGTDDIGFTSTSNSYCNGGGSATWRDVADAGSVAIVACTVPGTSVFAAGGQPTIFSSTAAGVSDGSGCVLAGGSLTLDTSNNPVGCLLNGTTYHYNPAVIGCNDIVSGGSNDSPLICPITETFDSFSAASSGPNGAEYSRVAGGIHTPIAVADALSLGNGIGEALAAAANIPEPPTALVLSGSALAMGWLRRRRPVERRHLAVG